MKKKPKKCILKNVGFNGIQPNDMWLFQNFQEYPYDEDLIMNSVISEDAYIWSPNAMMDIRIHVRCYIVVML